MRRVLSLLVFLIITFAAVGTANAELRWNKLGLDSDTRIYISPGYEQDHRLYALSDKDFYLSVDEGKTWNKTSTMPVWYVSVEQDKNIYMMQGADRNTLAIYKYNPLVQGDWEKLCNAPPATMLFTVTNNGTLIAVNPSETRSTLHLLRAESPNYTWQDTGFTRAGEYFENTPDGIIYTRENGTDKISRSLTDGITWEETNIPFEIGRFYISPDYSSDGKIFTIINRTNIYVSYDRGENWQEYMNGIKDSGYLADVAFSPDYEKNQTIYALDEQGHVFVSLDGAANWKSFGITTDDEAGYEFNSLAVLPGGELLAGTGDGIYEVTTYISPADLAELTRVTFIIGETKYTIGQQDWLMDTAPFVEKDRTYVPVRYLAYAMGINDNGILWDGTKNEATLTKNKTMVKITVGSYSLMVNNQLVAMDVMPQIRDGRVFLPARWVAEAFGASVSWDEQKKSVVIEYQK